MFVSNNKQSNKILSILLLIIICSLMGISNKDDVSSMVKPAVTMEEYDYHIEDGFDLWMNFEYGYDGYVKYGRYMNVSANFYNDASKDFSGYIEVVAPKMSSNTVYRKEVKLLTDSTSQVDISIPVNDDTGLLQIRLVTEQEKVIFEEKFNLEIGNYTKEVYFGIITDEQERLSYLDTINTKIFYLDESNIPNDYLALDIFDVIIINQYDTSRLSTEQLMAIEKWVINGGTLVIGTGDYYKDVIKGLNNLSSFKIEHEGKEQNMVLEVDQERINQLKNSIYSYMEDRKVIYNDIVNRNKYLTNSGIKPIEVEELNGTYIINYIINQLKPESIEKIRIPIKLTNGTMVSINNEELMNKIQLGNGTIQLYQFELGLDIENKTLGISQLHTIMENFSDKQNNKLGYEYYGSNSNYGVLNSMSYTDTNNIPRVWDYIFIILIYIVLIGPVSYVILKKKDKRSFTWVVVPALAIVFTFIIYMIGSKTRIKEPFVGYVELMTYQDDNTVFDEMYLSFISPHNQRYNTILDSRYNITELRDSSYNYRLEYLNPKNRNQSMKYISSITYGKDSTEIEVVNNPAFSPIYYQYKDSYSKKTRLLADVQYNGSKVGGYITNDYDYNLNNVALVSDGFVINLGSINSKETITIQDKDYVYLNVRDEIYYTDIIKKIAGANGDEEKLTGDTLRRYNLLNYIIDERIYQRSESFIIALVDEDSSKGKWENDLINDLASERDTYGIKGIIMPIEVDYDMKDLTLVPSIDKYLNNEYKGYDSYYNSRYMNSEPLLVEYELPRDDSIKYFNYLKERNTDTITEYLKIFVGDIYFYNYSTSAYDKVFSNRMDNQEIHANNYLEDNKLKVQFIPDSSIKGHQIIVPHISYLKEAK